MAPRSRTRREDLERPHSCLYLGRVRHRRREPVEHAFSIPLFLTYLDLEEVPELFDGHWLWSARRPAPAWLRRSDYLGDADVPLPEAVRGVVEAELGWRPKGPIRMLTQLRIFGILANPLTVYYCFDERDEHIAAVVAEVTNTPWGERHRYVIPGSGASFICHSSPKVFHVSPFMEMDMDYRWSISTPRHAPGSPLGLQIVNEAGDSTALFDATLSLRRHEITRGSLLRVLLQYPFMTLRVLIGIYWHALRLLWKGVPFVPHPDRAVREERSYPSRTGGAAVEPAPLSLGMETSPTPAPARGRLDPDWRINRD